MKQKETECVSIIVPVYNAEKYLKVTIESVLQQSIGNWELLLVDDCSTDHSLDIMKQYEKKEKRIRVICQESNQGAAKARNRGLAEATGRFIAFLDGDDIWKPEKLKRQLLFQSEKKAAFVFCGYEFADEEGRGLGKVVKVPESLTYRQALKNTTIFTSTVLFDTAKIAKEFLQMPEVKSEDTATWWKILRQNYVAYGLDENLVLYRRSQGTLSANKLEAVKRIWILYRNVENLSVLYSFYNFMFYALRAVWRRI